MPLATTMMTSWRASSLADEEKCTLCDTVEAEHGDRVHPFTPPGRDPGSGVNNEGKKKEAPKAELVVAPQTGGDPVLRLALINKGVIDLADIIAAEQQIAAAARSGTPAFAQAPAAGHPEDRPAHP